MEADHLLSASRNQSLFAVYILQNTLDLHTLLQECLCCNSVFFKIKLVFGFWMHFSFSSTEALSTSVEGRDLKCFLSTGHISLLVCLDGPLQSLTCLQSLRPPPFPLHVLWWKPHNSVWYLMLSLWQLQQLCAW